MSHSLSLLFYIKKSKADEYGKAVIYLRITLNGRRAECSIHRKVKVDDWHSKTQRALGNSQSSHEINREISIITDKIYGIQHQFQREGKSYTALNLRDSYLGKDKSQALARFNEMFQTISYTVPTITPLRTNRDSCIY